RGRLEAPGPRPVAHGPADGGRSPRGRPRPPQPSREAEVPPMIRDPNVPIPDRGEQDAPLVPRVFLREPGWKVGMKVGSEREFCHHIAPGDDAYHRLADGEIFIYSPEEKLCLPCADRRGLLHYE